MDTTLFVNFIAESISLVAQNTYFTYLNVGKPKISALILYFMAMVGDAFVYMTLGRDYACMYNYIAIVLFVTFSSKEKPIKFRLFMGILCLTCILITDFLSYAIFILLGRYSFDVTQTHSFNNEILILPLITIVMVLLSTIVYTIQKKSSSNEIDKLLLCNPICQFLFVVLLGYILRTYQITITHKHIIILYALAICFCMVSNVLIIKVSDNIIKNKITKQKEEFMEHYSAMATEYQTNLENNLMEIRKIRHDFNNSLQTIKCLIDNNDISNASKLVSQIEGQYKSTTYTYCENAILDVILKHSVEVCSKESIELTIDCSIPKDIPISQIDICNLSNNLLHNSIEAVRNISSDQIAKYIKFSAWVDEDMIIFKTVNSKEHTIKTKQKKILTSKADTKNHGLGLSIIEHISKTYGGNFYTEYDDNSFTTVVQLNI